MKQKTKYTVWDNTKYMLQFIRQTDKGTLPALALYAIPAMLAPLMSTLLLKMLIDILESGGDLTKIIIAVCIFVLLSAVFTVLKDLLIMKLQLKDSRHRLVCQNEILKQSMQISYKNIESREKRKLLEKAQEFTNYSNRGAGSLSQGLARMVMNFLGVFSACAIFWLVDFRMVFILAVVGICTFLLYSLLAEKNKNYSDEMLPSREKLFYLACGKPTEIKAAKDIRVFNISSWFSPLIDSLIGDRMEITNRFFKSYSKYRLLEALLILIREGVSMYFLISSTLNGQISVSDFAFYFGILNAFSVWMKGIATEYQELKAQCLLCDDYRIFVEQKPENREDKSPVDMDMHSPCRVEFKNVSFSYDGKKQILKHISFAAEQGEKIAIVGENGAGKTTCMKLLSGLYAPDSGEIFINGINTANMPLAQQFALFSAVFQDAFSLPATISENVALSSSPNAKRVNCALQQAGLYEKISSLANGTHTLLDKELNEGGMDLSGGELQKLFLARALYKDAPIIILDEPTAALDPIAENDLYLKFNELTKNKTAFYISHRLSSTRFCDRILYLKDGEITETGTHDELMTKQGGYCKMYEIQSYYYKEQEGII